MGLQRCTYVPTTLYPTSPKYHLNVTWKLRGVLAGNHLCDGESPRKVTRSRRRVTRSRRRVTRSRRRVTQSQSQSGNYIGSRSLGSSILAPLLALHSSISCTSKPNVDYVCYSSPFSFPKQATRPNKNVLIFGDLGLNYW